MRSWLILSGAVLFLGAAFGWYSSVPEPQGVAENPMAYASDEWVVWRSMDRRMATATLVELLPTLDTGRVPQSKSSVRSPMNPCRGCCGTTKRHGLNLLPHGNKCLGEEAG